MSKLRKATHAGSWYSSSARELNSQLSGWLSEATLTQSPARAIIAPHAGYQYCGSCGGYAYKQIDPSTVKRVFILGPSHHARLSNCALTGVERYQTPFYDLTIDAQICARLQETGMFDTMSQQVDEDEHSIEMHLPYVAKVMESRRDKFTVVPVLVGSLSYESEQVYGEIFAPYLADPDNLFVISSDFCHWGQRFRYTFYEKSHGEIWQSIEHLDRQGMNIIESMDPAAFHEYLRRYQNTICGRHPIGVFLQALAYIRKHGNGHQYSVKFVQYDQSSRCVNNRDSSVSYASASLTIK